MRQYTPETIWVGLDVHQASITAAILYGDNPDPEIVRLPGDLNPTRRLFRRLAENGVPRACYEASGAGYVLQRALDHDGFHCDVIAPSLIPSRPGDHRKTDRLDVTEVISWSCEHPITTISAIRLKDTRRVLISSSPFINVFRRQSPKQPLYFSFPEAGPNENKTSTY